VRICHITDLDFLVTDQPPEAELVRICSENDVSIEIATSQKEEHPR
jgi:DeoR/GlpR family transcriptional regulator of sugar metabolism